MRSSAASAGAVFAACVTLAVPAAAQTVPTRYVNGGPVRIDDGFVTMSYACVSFTNLDPRTATAVGFALRFTLPNGLTNIYSFGRLGTFTTGVPILGPGQGDTHAGPAKLANCAQLEAPEEATDATFYVTRVEFADGTHWTPSDATPAPASPAPASSSAPSPAPKPST